MKARRNFHWTMLAFVKLDERFPPDHRLEIINRVTDDGFDRISDD